MIAYNVIGNEVCEMVDGKVTASFKRDCADGVKIQLLQKDTDGSIAKFFAGEEKEKVEKEKESKVKKNVKKARG